MPSRFDVIFFDWGGTLANVVRQTESMLRGATVAAEILIHSRDPADIESLGSAVVTAESQAGRDPQHREVDLHQLLTDWLQRRGISTADGLIDQAIDAVGDSWIGSLDAYPGTVTALATLQQQGVRMGLVSNVILPRRFCLRELERLAFAPYFDFVVTSSEVGYRKPAPQVYTAALKAAFGERTPGDLSRALFVGDSPAFDIIEPAKLGMKTAQVTTAPGIWPRDDHERARPDYRIDAVAELPDLIL